MSAEGSSRFPAAARPPAAPPGPALRVGLLLGVLGALLLGLWPHLPRAVEREPAEGEFSALRAFPLIEEIARAPHPTGSAEADRVRGILVERLAAIGLAAEVQETIVIGDAGLPGRHERPPPPGAVEAARVRNIIARRPGTAPRTGRDAILLVAHHDSQPMSPGAADDGSGVATILEVLRALSVSEPLERDVIVLLSDAEELGLWGARAFVAEHPLAATVAVAVNLEARGRTGPSRMFETTAGNAGWIERLDRATGPIVAESLSTAVYRALPRDTDLTVLRQGGIAGYNFAFIGGVAHYHTALDRPEHLDLRSVEAQGRHALALVRELGRGELPAPTIDDAVHFPLGPELWRFGESASRALAAGALAAALAALVLLLRRRALRIGGVLRASVGWLAVLLFTASAALVAARLLEALLATGELRPTRFEARSGRALLALLLVAAAALAAGWEALRRLGISRADLAAGALAACGLLAILLEAFLPGAGYLGSIPLGGGALALLAAAAGESRRGGDRVAHSLALSLLGAAPFLALWPPVLAGLAAAFGPASAPALALLGALPLPLLAPLPAAIVPAAIRRRPFPPLLTAALAAFLVAATTARHDPSHPRAGSIHYDLDATRGIAEWVSADPDPGDRERELLGETPARGEWIAEAFSAPPEGVWTRAAPTATVPAPAMTLIGADAAGGARDGLDPRLLRIDLPEGTARLDLVVEGAPLRRVSLRALDGSPRPLAEELERLRLHAPPARVELRIEGEPAGPLALRATAMRYGLPALPGAGPRLREPHEVDAVGERTTVTVRFAE